MRYENLSLGSPGWLWPAVILAVLGLALLIWSYGRGPGRSGVRALAALLKAAGLLLVLFCLVEPLVSGSRPRPGANFFVILVDESRSMAIRDPDSGRSRGELVQRAMRPGTGWRKRLEQDFELRRYRFAERLQAVDAAAPTGEDEARDDADNRGQTSSMVAALRTLQDRFQGQPLAGILLVTDGNATDRPENPVDWTEYPPVYPVPVGSPEAAPDVRLGDVAVTQTNFELAPVTVKAEVAAAGYAGRPLLVQLLDADGREVERQELADVEETQPRLVRFRFRPEDPGTAFYQLRVAPADEGDVFASPRRSREATLENNQRWVAVDRPEGPYRVLYVSGRPNWEFKFLRRAVQEDAEVQLVGLLRIAKREPKFAFLSRAGESTNPLYRGFEPEDSESAEQYDEPVLIRLGTRDDAELRTGFPKVAEELFAYHAVIVDDLEAESFTQDQLLLLQQFVSVRGGGFLMLGGAESLRNGEYRRTPVGEMLPVYLDRQTPPDDTAYRLVLTREGWLQPWIRLRETEAEERKRLAAMPEFQVLNRTGGLKPGAQMLAAVAGDPDGQQPALVVQRFGKGQAGVLLVGDFWRWGMRRGEAAEDDLAQAWRQTVRWLVSDVPGRVRVTARSLAGEAGGLVDLASEVCGPEFQPLDNASVEFQVTSSAGEEFRLRGEPSDETAGSYRARFRPRQPGAYRVRAVVKDADGSEIGTEETGWAAEPAAEEFRRLTPDRELLGRIANDSGGELVRLDDLDSFVAGLPNRKIPITEQWIHPLWQKPWLFLVAIACLIGEWGLRRWKGLP